MFGFFSDLHSEMTGVPLLLLRLLGGWLDLGGLALLLLLFDWVEGHRGVDLGSPLLEELVHLVVGLGDHLGGSRSAPPVAGGGLLHDWVCTRVALLVAVRLASWIAS